MSEEGTPTPTIDPGATPTTPTPAAPATEPADLAAEVEKWKALSRKNEDRATTNAGKAKDYDALKASQMTEQEKAVTEAKAAGRSEALKEAGSKLVAAELKAAVAGRIDPTKLEALFGGLNTASFLTDEGDVDAAKVKAFADALPEPTAEKPTWPTLGQGQQGSAPTSTDPLTRAVIEKLGIK